MKYILKCYRPVSSSSGGPRWWWSHERIRLLSRQCHRAASRAPAEATILEQRGEGGYDRHEDEGKELYWRRAQPEDPIWNSGASRERKKHYLKSSVSDPDPDPHGSACFWPPGSGWSKNMRILIRIQGDQIDKNLQKSVKGVISHKLMNSTNYPS